MKVRKDGQRGSGDGLIKPSFGGPKKKRFGQKGNNNKPKTRKELRKEMRKNKKTQKHTYILNRLGKISPEEEAKKRNKKNKKRNRRRDGQKEDREGGSGGGGGKGRRDREEEGPFNRPGYSMKADTTAVKGQRGEDDLELEELKKEMEYTRKKRLLEENEHEEKVISQLEKRLKLNKKAKVPASFKVDGLDYLLELCERTGTKSKKESLLKPNYKKGESDEDNGDSGGSENEMNYSDEGSDIGEEEDGNSDQSNDDVMDDDDDDEEVSDEEDEGEDPFGMEAPLSSNEEDDDAEGFLEAEEMDSEDSDAEEVDKYENNIGIDKDLDKEKMQDDIVVKKKKKTKKKPKEKDELWEDIYGRMRRKDGTVVDDKSETKEETEKDSEDEVLVNPVTTTTTSNIATGKYVPPMRRQNQTQRDKISRSLKGLLNRLSEGNMHSISTQIEELYMANSRNEMNECVLELLYALLLRKVVMPERVVLEHVMLIAILHANIGTEIGAFFLQNFVQDFRTKYDEISSIEDNKELENLILLISAMYHFKIVDACLVYDILNLMAANFSAKDVELILTALRSIGFRLRKDDPLALKALIILIQQKATEAQSKSNLSSAKVKFMLDIVMAIRNNNMSKIPNYDPSVGEHLLKILKSHIHKGNYVSVMKIKMQDLLNAETKGRWWIVGSAWTNTGAESNPSSTDTVEMSSKEKQTNAKLLSKARSLGMNTETRKNVFCILMTAEDYLDAFEKLNHLDLKNNQEREIIHVSTYCCLHEKKFNPYYGLIAAKFCTADRKYMLTLQYNLWDRLKDLNSLKSHQLLNLAKLLVHFINDRTLPLSTLKVIEYAEMDKVKLKFLKATLSGILLQKDQENMQEIFMKAAMSEKLNLFRESVRLFMCHFMLQPTVTTSDGEVVGCDMDPKTLQFLKKRIKIAESTMSLGKSRVQL